MKSYEERERYAQYVYEKGMEKVRATKEPDGQKFPIGSRVKIADDLGVTMSHFPSGKLATVKYTYAHAFWGNNVKSYCLDVDGVGECAWYDESQLTLIV